jgi:hypothetical protein
MTIARPSYSLSKSSSFAFAAFFNAACPVFAQNAPAPVPTPNPEAAQQYQQSPAWGKLPKMQLEGQFAGPLQDTIVQRWRVPSDGTICFIYLPIAASHTPPTALASSNMGATQSEV